MAGLLTWLFSALVLFSGGFGAEWWITHHPRVEWRAPGIVGHVLHVKLPDSLKEQRDAALAAGRQDAENLQVCRANAGALRSALDTQNASIEALGAESARRTAEAAQALAAAQKGRASAEARAADLLNHPPTGVDACARMFSADDAVLGSLKP